MQDTVHNSTNLRVGSPTFAKELPAIFKLDAPALVVSTLGKGSPLCNPQINVSKLKKTPLGEIPKFLTSRMKALGRHGNHAWDYRPIPRRHFATLSGVERRDEWRDVDWPMWVVEISVDGGLSRASVWCAPNEATFNNANHGDAAPSDAELGLSGWRPTGLVAV